MAPQPPPGGPPSPLDSSAAAAGGRRWPAGAGTAVCALDALPPGSRRIVRVEGREIGLFNVEGRVYAVRNSCPHRAAPLCLGRLGGTTLPSQPYEYIYGRQGLVLRCPWHGWEFDLETGEPLVNHGLRAKTYPVEIHDGQIVLRL